MTGDEQLPPAGPSAPGEGSKPIAEDIDPATVTVEEDEEARLPDQQDETAETVAEGPLATGRAASIRAVQHAPVGAGVYRMLGGADDVLYVGKAKSVRKRLASYLRPTGQLAR